MLDCGALCGVTKYREDTQWTRFAVNIDLILYLASQAISFGAGLAALLIGCRVIGKKPGQSAKFDEWQIKYGNLFKIGGGILMVTTLYIILERVSRPDSFEDLLKNPPPASSPWGPRP